MQKRLNITSLLFLIGAFSLFSQNPIPKVYNGVKLSDISGNIESYTVARDSMVPLLYPSAISYSNKDLLIGFLKPDTVRHVELKKSMDGGKTWDTYPVNIEGTNDFQTLKLFGNTVKGKIRSTIKNETIIFLGGTPLKYGIFEKEKPLEVIYPVGYFGAYRITDVIKLNNGTLMALFHDDGRFFQREKEDFSIRKSVIYKIYSYDNGLTWTLPQIALVHNMFGIYDAVVFRSSNKKDRELVILASERVSGTSYISFSKNEGESWTYPVSLPDFIQGDRFAVSVINKTIYIVYRDLCRYYRDGSINPFFGDLVMWTGDIKELVKGRKNGVKVRIADNFPTDENIDMNDRRVFDMGYPSIIQISKNKLAIIAYGRWDQESIPYIKNFIVNTELLK